MAKSDPPPPSPRDTPPSAILLDEYFAGRDGRFVKTLRRFNAPRKLEAYVEKWKNTPGDWAREQIGVYFDLPLDAPGHEVVVKRLFKHVEEKEDDEAVAWCMVGFDRLVRRRRKRRMRYDWQTNQSWAEESLVTPSNRTQQERPAKMGKWKDRRTKRVVEYVEVPAVKNRPGNRLFSYKTRHYLRRRAWRYFRRLGYMQPERYVRGVAHALARYTDEDFALGENIVDNWAVMHACYFTHPAIEFTAAYCRLRPGHTLGDLTPAPYHGHLWRETEAFDVLLDLLAQARSSLVRLWSLEMIKAHHAALIKSLTPDKLMPLLDHTDSRVQGFAAEAFGQLDGLGSLRIETWLRLLDGTNIAALTLICDAMRRHVSLDRLDDEQLLALAQARPAPVARMGLELLQLRHEGRALRMEQLTALADMRCRALSGEGAAWVLGMMGDANSYSAEHASAFFDSAQRPARQAAMGWLNKDVPGWDDPALWARLIETPYDDLRLGVVEKLETRRQVPGRDADALAPVWTAVVLGVHRGGRRKPDAIRQVARAIVDRPERARELVPVLGLAVRSIRGPERRAGLAGCRRAGRASAVD